MFKRVLSFLICAVMLTSCSQKAPTDISVEHKVTIMTAETRPTEGEHVVTETSASTEAASSQTNASFATEPSATTTSTTNESVSSDSVSSSPYDITPVSGVMYAIDSVNVRLMPDPDSTRMGHLNKGEEVSVTGIVSNGWVRVIFDGGEYFVNGKYLSEKTGSQTDSTETEPPKSTVTTVTTTVPKVTTTVPPTTTAPTTATVPATTTEPTTTEPPEEIPDEPPEYIEEDLNVLIDRSHYTALNYSKQKAVWFAFLDIQPMIKDASSSQFRKSVSDAFDEVKNLGCNTVYVHVRSHGDAYYYSDYYPFTSAYSGTIGVRPDYDPLKIMIEEAHNRGLSFHAWINPMRTTTSENYALMSSQYPLKQWYDSSSTKGKFLVYDKDTDFYWLSPAYTAVRELICNGVAELVSNYDIDAIHIDDYFYPTTSSSFDKDAFEASGASDRTLWRRSVVNTLVREIYSTVKSCNSTVLFGVSPQGNVDNNMNKLYADVETWCRSTDYLDYIVPQIYYGFNNSTLPFDSCANQWAEMVRANPRITLVCGIAAYKVGGSGEWSSGDILTKQVNFIKDINNYSGIAFYRYDSFYGSAVTSQNLMKTELKTLKNAIQKF